MHHATKGSDPFDVRNYRPISLLCILSKLLETIIYDKIIDFVIPQVSSQQFGFLRKRSCVNQLLSFYSEIFSSVDRKIPCDVIFLDFQKAFDSIPHPELLFKLWAHGITGQLWNWFQSYLSNRTHFVYVEGSSSSVLPVKSGVPQGSVLGPLLFLLYVNDIPNIISYSTSYLFADDTKFMEVIDRCSKTTHIQQDLDTLHSWCSKWKLSLNSKKCAAIYASLLTIINIYCQWSSNSTSS